MEEFKKETYILEDKNEDAIKITQTTADLNQDDFHIVETDTFLLISDLDDQNESKLNHEDVRMNMVYYQTLLQSKLNRKKELQKRLQRFSGILWLGRIIRNLAKLQCEKVIKAYETELSKSFGLLKNVECMDQKADAIEIKTTKEDIIKLREKLGGIYFAKKLNFGLAKTNGYGTQTESFPHSFKEPSKDNDIYKKLAVVENECNNLEIMSTQLTNKIIITVSELKEMNDAILDFKDILRERRFKKARELREKHYKKRRESLEKRMKKRRESQERHFKENNEAYEKTMLKLDEEQKRRAETLKETEKLLLKFENLHQHQYNNSACNRLKTDKFNTKYEEDKFVATIIAVLMAIALIVLLIMVLV